jgi:hypothetical protein
MPKKKATAKEQKDGRTWARTAGGNVKALFTITPEQEEALREEAFERARATGSRKPDASAVLREVLDEWLTKRR